MIIALAAALALFAVLLALGLSFYLTRRFALGETHTPAEVGLAYEEVMFNSPDGLALRGWFIPCPRSDCAVVLLHGHSGSIDADIDYLPALHEAGLNVLQFDFRGHGRSDGQIVSFGYLESQDAAAAAAYLKQRGMRRVALVGFSLGGIAAILAGAVSPDVDAVVDDGAPARISRSFAAWGLERGLPAWLASVGGWLAMAGASLRLGANLFDYEAVNWVGKIAPRPLLLIHGEQDPFCPDFDDLARAAGPGAQVWRVEGMGHTQIGRAQPEAYRQRLVGFLKENL